MFHDVLKFDSPKGARFFSIFDRLLRSYSFGKGAVTIYMKLYIFGGTIVMNGWKLIGFIMC